MTELSWTVEIAPGADLTNPDNWVWVDVTSYVRSGTDITISYGRSDEWSQVGTTTCNLTLNNWDGDFSPRNPNGQWYGQIGMNTPLRISYGSGDNPRFIGYVSQWPPRWGAAVGNAWTPIQAAGIIRRLSQGVKPLHSTLYRQIMSYNPIGYWPFEDGENATRAGTPITSNRSASAHGISFGATGGPPGSESLASATAASAPRFLAFIPQRPGTGAWHVEMVYKLGAAPPDANYSTIFRVGTTGSADWRINVNNTQFLTRARTSDDTLLVDQAGPAAFAFGQWVRIALTAKQNGSSVDWLMRWFPIGHDGSFMSGSYTGTLGEVEQITSDFGAGVDGMGFGHLAVFSVYDSGAYNGADTGNAGELAGHRMERLCNEEGVPFTVTSDHIDTMKMGPQAADTLLNLLQTCADADGGALYELEGKLSYQSRIARMNQDVALTVEQLSTAPEPTDDDQQLRNDVTANRTEGSSARRVDQDNIDAHGLYDHSVDVNVYNDDPLGDIAGWQVHLGTVDDMRWPSISTTMQYDDTLIPDWLAFGFGQRMRVYQDIEQLPAVDIDVMVDGWTETITPQRWDVGLNTVPAKPWNVIILDQKGRIDTAGSTLSSDVSTPDAELTPNAGFETNLDGWESTGVGTVDRSWEHARRGSWSAKLTPNGTAIFPYIWTTSADAGSITAGNRYTCSAWVYSVGGYDSVGVALKWCDSSGARLSQEFGDETVIAARQWTLLTVTATAPATAVKVGAWVRMYNTPSADDVLYIDEAQVSHLNLLDVTTTTGPLWTTDPAEFPFEIIVGGEVMQVSAITGASSPQEFVVTRAINGISKAHDTGTDVRLKDPLVISY